MMGGVRISIKMDGVRTSIKMGEEDFHKDGEEGTSIKIGRRGCPYRWVRERTFVKMGGKSCSTKMGNGEEYQNLLH